MSTSAESETTTPTPNAPDISATLEMLGKVLHTLGIHAQELLAYAWYYVGLHVESLKLKVVWLATLALCGLSMLLVVGLALAAAAVMFVVGGAQLVGEHLFAGQIAWGYLTVGAGMLVVIPLSVLLAGRIAQRVLARELRQKFAQKQQLQRTKYGHDIQDAPRLPAEILAQEKAQAADAMRATLREMWNQVPSRQQVLTWAQENPLLAAGAVAGAGALAGAVLTPSDHRPAPVVVKEPVAAAVAHGSLLSMVLSQALPMLGMVVSEAGRNALLAALLPQANGVNSTTTADAAENVAPIAGDGAGI